MTDDEVDTRIEQWHTMDTGTFMRAGSPSLGAYLGWTDEEYSQWVRTTKIPKERNV